MPAPTLERCGDALYLSDDTGQRWRVHDAHFTGGRPHRVPLGDPRANTRYFIAQDGTRRAFTFGRQAQRGLTLDVLAEQLRGAGFVGQPFDATPRTPR